MSQAEVIKQAIRGNSGAWWETYGKIADKSNTLVQPRMNYLQRKMEAVKIRFEELGLPVRIIALKPRQKGLTTFSTGLLYHAMRKKRTAACIIGGQYSQTHKAWQMVDTYLSNDRFDWGNTGAINEERGRFSHGSTLEPETARDFDAGRSGTIQFLIATECARWALEGAANAAVVLAGILKCVPLLPDTCVILESTAKGAAGDFYNRWLQATDAEDFLAGAQVQPGQYVRVFAPWFEFEDSCIRLSEREQKEIENTLDAEEWYRGEAELIEAFGRVRDDGVRVLGGSVNNFSIWEQLAWRRWAIREECSKDIDTFNEDYPDTWGNAFLRSGRVRFNAAGLRAMRKRAAMHAATWGVLETTKTPNRYSFRQTTKDEGTLQFWERPMVGRKYLVVVDPMTGATQTGSKDPDCHAVFVMRQGYFEAGRGWVRPAIVARVASPCRWDIDMVSEHVWRLANYFGGGGSCLIVVEVNMDRGIIELLRLRGANLYQRELFNKRENRMANAYGFQTTPATREMVIETLARAVREWDRDGEGVDIWDLHAIEEMENFIVKENGRSEASDGHHDDDVLAAAIGLTLIGAATAYNEPAFVRPLPRDIVAAEVARRRYVGVSENS